MASGLYNKILSLQSLFTTMRTFSHQNVRESKFLTYLGCARYLNPFPNISKKGPPLNADPTSKK